MPHHYPEPEFSHDSILKTGILLVNLGTPESPTAPALKKYLRQFLSDPRVVEIPRWIWWFILNGIILTTRPAKSAHKYASIWTAAGSPLRVNTEKQVAKLSQQLSTVIDSPLVLTYAMRYGTPSIHEAIKHLKSEHCDRIVVLPLYPQYASSTTGSSFEAIFTELNQYRNIPAVRTIKHYHDDPRYINSLKNNIESFWSVHGRPDVLVMSFHGVPKFTLNRGDPYHCECHKTARLLASALGLQAEQYRISFQSLFGKAEWIKPYTEPLIKELAQQGVNHVQVVCPGFLADCLETLEEIGQEVRNTFLTSGGRVFHYIPALNDEPDWIQSLSEIVLEQLSSWVHLKTSPPLPSHHREICQKRALALGAKK